MVTFWILIWLKGKRWLQSMIESNASIYDWDFKLFKLVADALERDDG